MQVQYISNEQGKQVGVLLGMADYHRLTATKATDPELLAGLSKEELDALSNSKLMTEAQSQLSELLAQQKEMVLSSAEEAQLDQLLLQIDHLTILKTRARYTLQNQSHNSI